MKLDVKRYSTWIFDCDGVLLDSNGAKAKAFYTAALPYGESAAQALKSYHQANGGITRFAKFRYLFETLLGRKEYEDDFRKMTADFSAASRAELARCQVVTGVKDLLTRAPESVRRFVISGAEEEELRWSLEIHGLAPFFDGIYGSPRSKPEILTELAQTGQLVRPSLFFGDSRYDHQSAVGAGCDFVFVSGVTDYPDWQEYTAQHGIIAIADFRAVEV